MKRLALVAILLALALPGAARSAACSPLNCAPSQFSVGNGTLLGYRDHADGPVTIADLRTGKARFALPAGIVGGDRLVSKLGRTLAWYDMTTGRQTDSVTLAHDTRFAGVSQDGARAVGFQLTDGGSTTITIASPAAQRDIRIDGRDWDFDGLRGDNLFLIKNLSGGGYQVRVLHLESGQLDAALVKDPHESGTIWGQPYSRLASADGRYLFTLYIGQNGGAMVHALDLETANARCIDLPGTGNYLASTLYAMVLSNDGRTLWAVGAGYGRVVGIDVAARTATTAFTIGASTSRQGKGTRAALSPDGKRIALSDGDTVSVLNLRTRKIVKRKPVPALAIGYAPDGSLRTFS
jgi:hypothetical protein